LNSISNKVEIIDLGQMDYVDAWEMQKKIHSEVVLEKRSSTFLVVEHPEVLTLGKNSDRSNIKTAADELKKLNILVQTIDRGGEVTAHMPGQIVVYPIFSLPGNKLGARSYVEALERAVINTLQVFGIAAVTDPINPGVWINNKKVCAIGIRIKKRVCLHGIALNFDNDLSFFGHIVPCGIEKRSVTNIISETKLSIDKSELKSALVKALAEELGFSEIRFCPEIRLT